MDKLLPGYTLKNGVPVRESNETCESERVAPGVDAGTAAIVTGGDKKDFAGEREKEVAEFDRLEAEELDRLKHWSEKHGIWAADGYPAGLTYESSVASGMEHFVHPGDGIVKKFTHPRACGTNFAYYGEFNNGSPHIRSATPAEYFARIAWHNQIFPASAISIKSVSPRGVYSHQIMVHGRFPRDRFEVDDLMALQGWEKREGTLYHPGFGVYLLDLHTFNGLVVETAKGDHLLPIDTIIFPEPARV